MPETAMAVARTTPCEQSTGDMVGGEEREMKLHEDWTGINNTGVVWSGNYL